MPAPARSPAFAFVACVGRRQHFGLLRDRAGDQPRPFDQPIGVAVGVGPVEPLEEAQLVVDRHVARPFEVEPLHRLGAKRGAGEGVVAAHSSGSISSTMRTRARCINSFTASLEMRSEEHTSELQSLMRISYAVFCLKKK